MEPWINRFTRICQLCYHKSRFHYYLNYSTIWRNFTKTVTLSKTQESRNPTKLYLKAKPSFLLSIYGEPGQVKCFQHKTNVLSEIKMSTFFTTASCRNTFQLTRVFLLKLAALSFKDFAHLNPNMFSHLSVIGNWNHGEPIVTFTGYSVIYRAATSVWN